MAHRRGARRHDAGDVIREWQGLGYNRRAVNLHRAACVITSMAGRRISPSSRSWALHGRRGRALRARPVRAPGRHERAPDSRPDRRRLRAGLGSRAMDLGATVCLARIPRCDECPLADGCPSNGKRYEPLRKQSVSRARSVNGARYAAPGRRRPVPSSLDDEAVAALAATASFRYRAASSSCRTSSDPLNAKTGRFSA